MPILFLTVVIDLIGFGIIIPIMPFIGLSLALNGLEIGLLIGIYSIFSGLFGPYWGRLSDRLGRKPVLLGCLTGTAISYIALAFCNSFWSILIIRALGGAVAGNFGIATAIVADITSPENRAKGMGMIGAAFGIGMTLGPFLGGILAGEQATLTGPALVAAGLTIFAIVIGGLFLKESLPDESRSQSKTPTSKPTISTFQLLKNTKNLWLSLQYFLHNHSVSLIGYLFPLWIAAKLGWGPKETGIIFGIQGLIIIIIQGGLMGRLVKRAGELRLLSMGILLIIFGYSLAIFATGSMDILITFYTIISGACCCMPVLNSLLSKRTPEQYRGRVMGTATSLSAWGRVAAPINGGLLLTYTSYTEAWILGVIVGLIYFSWVIREWLSPSTVK